MKKVCLSIIVVLGILMSVNIRANAAEAQVNVGIIGEIKEGSSIDIVVDFENMTNLYAASMDYTYDNSLIKVEEMVISPNMKNENLTKAYEDIASGGNKARYGYTNLGQIPGFSGTSNFLVIKAKVLKDGELNLTKDNFKLKLVKNQGGISEMLCDVHYPGASWEVVQAPGGTAYTSIEAKANSISESRISEITEENKRALEAVGGVTKEAADASTLEAKAEEKTDKMAKQIETDAQQAQVTDEDRPTEDSESVKPNNFWVVGVVGVALVAVGGFIIYKRRASNKNKS